MADLRLKIRPAKTEEPPPMIDVWLQQVDNGVFLKCKANDGSIWTPFRLRIRDDKLELCRFGGIDDPHIATEDHGRIKVV